MRRLIIKKIVLENFKSYYGRMEVGPLHSHFTAIVGPNGSGKSNTIEALLFVFGFPSRKMRFKNLSELIDNSANHHQDVMKATVEVHFEEVGEDEETIPDSTLVLSRSVTKSENSTYKINGMDKNLSEVKAILREKKIDLDNNRFLILQGEVEQISLMKPIELLEYIEEVVDTRRFKDPLDALDEDIAQQGRVKIKAYIQFTECSEVYQAISEQSERVITSMKLRARFLYLQYLDYCFKHLQRIKLIEIKKDMMRVLE